MKKQTTEIFVTGGTGLVGTHLLVQLTQQGKKIRALHRDKSDLEKVKNVFSYYFDDVNKYFNQIEWVIGDITDIPSLENVLKGIKQVYHCAAIVSFRRKDEQLMRKTNIEGTANMVNLALDNDVDKFCYVSSIATLDKKNKAAIIDESCEWNPENNNYDYAITKYGGEMEVWRASQEGLPIIIVHPGVILGSGYWNSNTGKFFTNAAHSFKYYTEGETGFVGVTEVAKAMFDLMESDIVNDHFILVAENKSFHYIMATIADALGTKAPSIEVNKLLANIAWRWAWLQAIITGKQPMITKHSAQAAQQKYHYSSSKITKELAFTFPTIKDSIIEYAAHYKQDFSI